MNEVTPLEAKTVHSFEQLTSLFRYWMVAGTSHDDISALLSHFEHLVKPATKQADLGWLFFFENEGHSRPWPDSVQRSPAAAAPAGTVPPAQHQRLQGVLGTGGLTIGARSEPRVTSQLRSYAQVAEAAALS